jgi:excisionase family DNA binding protein
MMTPKIDTDKLVTASQAARLLKITPAAIYKAIKRGRLPSVKIGRIFVIDQAHLKLYRKNKSVGGRPKKNPKKTG